MIYTNNTYINNIYMNGEAAKRAYLNGTKIWESWHPTTLTAADFFSFYSGFQVSQSCDGYINAPYGANSGCGNSYMSYRGIWVLPLSKVPYTGTWASGNISDGWIDMSNYRQTSLENLYTPPSYTIWL